MIDRDLKRNVESALDFEPSVDARDIGVSVADGVVTLRGNVHTYIEKLNAERAVTRVYGVKGIANDINVRIGTDQGRTDTEIAQAAVSALHWQSMIPADRVTVSVKDGWLSLMGKLDWQYQKDAAERAVRGLRGVKGVTNNISLNTHVSITDVREKIEAALKRSAELDARRINVTARDGAVILSGHVRTWAERKEAERAAWATPGVSQVDDRLTVVP